MHVYAPAALEARLQAVWQGLKDVLRSGDLAPAAPGPLGPPGPEAPWFDREIGYVLRPFDKPAQIMTILGVR